MEEEVGRMRETEERMLCDAVFQAWPGCHSLGHSVVEIACTKPGHQHPVREEREAQEALARVSFYR